MSMKIRRAKPEDAAEVCDLICRSITELCHPDHGGDEAHLSNWLSNKTVDNVRSWILQSHFFVGEQAERIVGIVAMNDSGKITLNYVDPAVRFHGVSKTLMLSMEENARTLGITECHLESSQTALRFYQALGYVKSEQSCGIPLTGSSATVLSKQL